MNYSPQMLENVNPIVTEIVDLHEHANTRRSFVDMVKESFGLGSGQFRIR